MTSRSTEYATFEIECAFDTSPACVFAAFADPAEKAKWFGPSDLVGALALDFQVGGREHFAVAIPDGMMLGYDAHYHEIVPDRRIVYSYTIDFDQIRISVSLATVEITPAGDRTRLLYTEQAVYLDGGDTSGTREKGTREEFDNLNRALSRRAPTT